MTFMLVGGSVLAGFSLLYLGIKSALCRSQAVDLHLEYERLTDSEVQRITHGGDMERTRLTAPMEVETSAGQV